MTTPTDAPDYTEAQFNQEYALFRRSPDYELANIRTALNLLPFLNGPQEKARLAAVAKIRRERAAAKKAAWKQVQS